MRLETRDYYSFSGMSAARAARFVASLFGLIVAAALLRQPAFVAAAAGTPTPEQFIGFKTGTDNKLARWDRIVDYMKQVAATSDRVRLRELGKTNNGNPFVMLEISSPETLKNLDRYKQYERKLYFQNGRAERARARRDLQAGQGRRAGRRAAFTPPKWVRRR